MSRILSNASEELITNNLLAIADADGRGRPLPMLPTAIPEIRLDGDCLAWGFPKSNATHGMDMGSRWLGEFVALADATPETILGFAQRFGPLGLCWDHSLPLLHEPVCALPKMHLTSETVCRVQELLRNEPQLEDLRRNDPTKFFYAIGARDPSLALYGIRFQERLSGWRLFSRWVRSVLQLAAEIKSGGSGEVRHWRVVFRRDPEPGEDRLRLLISAINVMMSMAQPTPMLSLSAKGELGLSFVNAAWVRESTDGRQFIGVDTQPLLFTGALFSAIVAATASTVATGRSLIRCSECKVLYTPKRAPVFRKLHFCPSCSAGGRVSRRLSKRRLKATRRKDHTNDVPKGPKGPVLSDVRARGRSVDNLFTVRMLRK